MTASTGRPARSVTNSSCRCSRRAVSRASRPSSAITRCLPPRSSERSDRSDEEALSRRSEPSSSTQRPIAFASFSSPGSTRSQSSARSGARLRCPVTAARAPSPTLTVVSISRSVAGESMLPRPACSAASLTSPAPASSGSAANPSRATASVVSACRRATSSRSSDGMSARARAAPCGVAVAPARRSTIAGYSRAASAPGSISRHRRALGRRLAAGRAPGRCPARRRGAGRACARAREARSCRRGRRARGLRGSPPSRRPASAR